jgi:dihydropteroate synthase/2-amino-4-hydroxy-6-hydroxymethyldihydropteridine diphosphokinase
MDNQTHKHEHTIYLGMGTNSGDRNANLMAAIEALFPSVSVTRQSRIYQTPPWGFTDQPDFLNLVIEGKTSFSPMELLTFLKSVESKVGRTASFRWGPREIDIDILFYGDLLCKEDGLEIPHPRLHQRAFVLVPLADLTPELVHPKLNTSISELLAEINTNGITLYQPENPVQEVKMQPPLKINQTLLDWGKQTYVMGILNITPDSFSGDGLGQDQDSVEAALVQARTFAAAGVHLLDIGGESTRPGSVPVGAEEENDRVLPVVRAISAELNLPISIDTYKAQVAEAALDAGAHLINDVWGLKADPEMAPLAARRGVPVILMHNRSTPKSAEVQEKLGGRYIGMKYDDLIEDIKNELLESVKLAKQAGIPDQHIILDTGIGFGKTVEQNLELLNRTDEIRQLGYPVMIGSSRKSFIGYTLDLPADQRAEGTAATVAVAITRGADIVRVHDVEMMARVAKMTDAIVRGF